MIVFTHPDCLEHNPGRGHPESVERLRALLARLEADRRFPIRTSGAAPREALLAVHPARYLDALEQVAREGGGRLDPDTVMSPASWRAAVAGAGACLAGLGAALEGTPAFAACRPPGHHALAEQAMGFCLLANAVIAARAAQEEGVDRVLIVDWDVHHGNGTQSLVERDPAIRYVSLHQWPAYPGTGRAEERGVGNLFNLPRPAGLPPDHYVEALWEGILAATTGWAPSLLVISAGFDAMAGDPLAGFTLEPGHYADWTRRLRDRFPAAGMLSLLEGGYLPQRLADGVLAHLGAA
jgi:acetoin utilization deacetylase AcuC-like enzyme